MKTSMAPRPSFRVACLTAALVLLAPLAGRAAAAAGPAATVTVFATGLNNPRGLKFGPDGNLYVAEGGTGGTNSTAGQCAQVVAPIGPYTGSQTGARISRIDRTGARTTVADNLPSSQTDPGQGSLVSGVGDVAFVGDTLYAVLDRRRLLAWRHEHPERRHPRPPRRDLGDGRRPELLPEGPPRRPS